MYFQFYTNAQLYCAFINNTTPSSFFVKMSIDQTTNVIYIVVMFYRVIVFYSVAFLALQDKKNMWISYFELSFLERNRIINVN